ncbi:hypothetical protein [Nesterenkonia sandarakina]|uniref:Secretion/DNA translocation related CpaE-like protein n=1 Tax=Nesterenkonia sandarakina TaxID=272918 RepID=A0A7Z0E6T5_9MICC|nr:hypothetical protein [Nesterenkonia sandarakina]NYJ16121.1 secretion/DNA translocation related CpaE-like protein [Nesterenkonia sandarakina]
MDPEPRLLLITANRVLRDDVALIAATVGAALECRESWDAAASRDWAVLMCGADAPPASARHGRGALLLGDPGGGPGEEQRLWKIAAEHTGLRPVPLPAAEGWLARHLSEQLLDRSPGRVVAVAGVLGGVGASTVAYLLAAEQAVRGASVLLIDADPAPGSGIATLSDARSHRMASGVGMPTPDARRRPEPGHSAEGAAEFGWEELADLEGEIAATQLAAALPVRDAVHVLSGAPGRQVRQRMLEPVVRAARRAFDTVLIDLGRDPETESLVREHLDQLLLVTPCSARGAAASRQLGDADGAPRMLVVNGAAQAGWDLNDLTLAADLPLAGAIPEQRWLRREEDLGAAYELLRSRRGASCIGALLEVLDLEQRVRHE